jgi:uncharacterized protein (DUF3084 family)
MSSGFILILAVLILGGVIATVGDRLGSRIGKARLSLFNLRPRRTATLVTILTGTLISGSTLGILFAASESLRTGVFELRQIQRKLRQSRTELDTANTQKSQIEKELSQARSDQAEAKQQLTTTQQQLLQTDKSLKTAVADREAALAGREQALAEQAQTEVELSRTQSQLGVVSGQAVTLRAEIDQLQADRDRLVTDRNQVVQERDRAAQERSQIAMERDREVAARDLVIAERQQAIAARDKVIQERETQLKALEAQQDTLTREVRLLEQEAQGLRRGNVAILRGQVLASAVVRVLEPEAAQQAVDKLLREANRVATQLARPGANEQIIQITKTEVEQLISQLKDGQDHVMRVVAGANYLVGETPIQVFVEETPNQVVFRPGDVVATTSLTPSTLTNDQLQQRINLLLEAANFRARRMGILTDTLQIGRIQSLISFVDRLRQYQQPLELKVVASDTTYTAGPLKVELQATQEGQLLFRSQDSAALP